MEFPFPDTPAKPDSPEEAGEPITWATLGFAPRVKSDGSLEGTIPPSVIVLAAAIPADNKALGDMCQQITTSHPFVFKVADCVHYAYALEAGLALPQEVTPPDRVKVLAPGATVLLAEAAPQHPLPALGEDALSRIAGPQLDPVILNSPLFQYSLRGCAEEFERQAVHAKPLLDTLCLSGQATVWFAPPGAGKTLITLKLLSDAVAEHRIRADNVYYINADDSSEGFATKIRLMDDMGCHTLAPGQRGFEPAKLPELLHAMAGGKQAKGALIIIDTIKKAVSLMKKDEASAFTTACRSAVMAGATIIGFAHTNKQPSASGKLQYGGTTDLRDDFDAAYIAAPIEASSLKGERVVQFECIKSRGGNARLVTYAYADIDDLSYMERLASVRLVSPDELRGFERIEEAKADAEVVDAIEAAIRSGDYAKMALAKVVAKRSGTSERAAIRMIEKYTGTDPVTAKWCFQRRDRGAMIYSLLPLKVEPETMAA